MNKSALKITKTVNAVRDLLLEKNAAYGDSALKPANIFAKGSAIDNIACRIDDKLMRIKNKGLNDATEDTIQDLIGYLILLKIAIEDERTQPVSDNISERITNGNTNVHNRRLSAKPNLDWWETSSTGTTSAQWTEGSKEKASGDPMGG